MARKVLMISADGFEDLELFYPYYRLQEAGHQPVLATPDGVEITGKHGYTAKGDVAVDKAGTAHGYDALVLPGGKAPAALREMEPVLELVRDFHKQSRPVAAICHGPQILISALDVQSWVMTSYHSVRPEVEEAGANYEDKEVVVREKYVYSRHPGDLPAFMREFLKLL
jgi:protease I